MLALTERNLNAVDSIGIESISSVENVSGHVRFSLVISCQL